MRGLAVSGVNDVSGSALPPTSPPYGSVYQSQSAYARRRKYQTGDITDITDAEWGGNTTLGRRRSEFFIRSKDRVEARRYWPIPS